VFTCDGWKVTLCDVVKKCWGWEFGDIIGVGVASCKTVFIEAGHFLFTCSDTFAMYRLATMQTAQRHRLTDRQQYDANSRSYSAAVRSAEKN